MPKAELAERAELAFETVSRVESGREPPSLRTAVSLADALGLPLDVVVGRTRAASTLEEHRTRAEVRRLAELVERIDSKVISQIDGQRASSLGLSFFKAAAVLALR